MSKIKQKVKHNNNSNKQHYVFTVYHQCNVQSTKTSKRGGKFLWDDILRPYCWDEIRLKYRKYLLWHFFSYFFNRYIYDHQCNVQSTKTSKRGERGEISLRRHPETILLRWNSFKMSKVFVVTLFHLFFFIYIFMRDLLYYNICM